MARVPTIKVSPLAAPTTGGITPKADPTASGDEALGRGIQQLAGSLGKAAGHHERLGKQREAFENKKTLKKTQQSFISKINEVKRTATTQMDDDGKVGGVDFDEFMGNNAKKLAENELEGMNETTRKVAAPTLDSITFRYVESAKSVKHNYIQKREKENLLGGDLDSLKDIAFESDIDVSSFEYSRQMAYIDSITEDGSGDSLGAILNKSEAEGIKVRYSRAMGDSFIKGQISAGDDSSDKGVNVLLSLKKNIEDAKENKEYTREIFGGFSLGELDKYSDLVDREIKRSTSVNKGLLSKDFNDIVSNFKIGASGNSDRDYQSARIMAIKMGDSPQELRRNLFTAAGSKIFNDFTQNIKAASLKDLDSLFPSKESVNKFVKDHILAGVNNNLGGFGIPGGNFSRTQNAQEINNLSNIIFSQIEQIKSDRRANPFESHLKQSSDLRILESNSLGVDGSPEAQAELSNKMVERQKIDGIFPSSMEMSSPKDTKEFSGLLKNGSDVEPGGPASNVTGEFSAGIYNKYEKKYKGKFGQFLQDAYARKDITKMEMYIGFLQPQNRAAAFNAIKNGKVVELSKLENADIEQFISDRTKDMRKLFANRDFSGNAINVFEPLKDLVKFHTRLQVSKGMDPGEAVDQAIDKFFNSNYHTIDGDDSFFGTKNILVPTAFNGVPVDKKLVEGHIDAYSGGGGLEALGNKHNLIIPPAFKNKEQFLDELESRSVWETAPDNSGLMLVIKDNAGGSVPVKIEVSGKPTEMIISWGGMQNDPRTVDKSRFEFKDILEFFGGGGK